MRSGFPTWATIPPLALQWLGTSRPPIIGPFQLHFSLCSRSPRITLAEEGLFVDSGRAMNEREKRLLVAHKFICALFDLRRERGVWITGGKTWDCIKWSYGDVSISRRAVYEWFSRPEIPSYRFPAAKLGGRNGSRAFVAEHVYPTRSLQTLVLVKFSDRNPTEREVAELLSRFNKICYVWHEENEALDNAGFKNSMPHDANEADVLARYRKVGIDLVETPFKNGPPLFRQLDMWRQTGISGDEAIGKLATFDR